MQIPSAGCAALLPVQEGQIADRVLSLGQGLSWRLYRSSEGV